MYFSLRDDSFSADRNRAIRICRLLIERNANILWNCQSRVTALDEELLTWIAIRNVPVAWFAYVLSCQQLFIKGSDPWTDNSRECAPYARSAGDRTRWHGSVSTERVVPQREIHQAECVANVKDLVNNMLGERKRTRRLQNSGELQKWQAEGHPRAVMMNSD